MRGGWSQHSRECVLAQEKKQAKFGVGALKLRKKKKEKEEKEDDNRLRHLESILDMIVVL